MSQMATCWHPSMVLYFVFDRAYSPYLSVNCRFSLALSRLLALQYKPGKSFCTVPPHQGREEVSYSIIESAAIESKGNCCCEIENTAK